MRAGGDVFFEFKLGGDFRDRPFVGDQSINGDAWENRDIAGINFGIPPPA